MTRICMEPDCRHLEESHHGGICTQCATFRMGEPTHTFLPLPPAPVCSGQPGRCQVHGRHKEPPAPGIDNLQLF